LRARCDFELCPVCYWEDDGQDDHDCDDVRGGPNGWLSLTQARNNFMAFGASDKDYLGYVRPPVDHEHLRAFRVIVRRDFRLPIRQTNDFL
jgi:hypothetical protein